MRQSKKHNKCSTGHHNIAQRDRTSCHVRGIPCSTVKMRPYVQGKVRTLCLPQRAQNLREENSKKYIERRKQKKTGFEKETEKRKQQGKKESEEK